VGQPERVTDFMYRDLSETDATVLSIARLPMATKRRKHGGASIQGRQPQDSPIFVRHFGGGDVHIRQAYDAKSVGW
jgi:hypothetical protein